LILSIAKVILACYNFGMNKIIYGVVAVAIGLVFNLFIIKGPTFPFGLVLLFVGFFLIWLGIIHKVVLSKWIKWILAAVLSIVTFYLLIYIQLVFIGM